MTTSHLMTIPTRASLVADELRGMIQSGELKPGSVLRQTEIAERFGVSTTPVREAFAVLLSDGMVRQDAHRSVVVFQPSLEELAEIYEIRGALEPLATELAAKRITLDQKRELDGIVDEMRTADSNRYVQLNAVLHRRIYEIAARPRLADIVDALRKTSANYINLTVQRHDPAYRERVQAEHEEIVAALRAGKGKQAARVVRQHLQTTAEHVTRLVVSDDSNIEKP